MVKAVESKPTEVDDYLNSGCEVKEELLAEAPLWAEWWSGSKISFPKSNIDIPVRLDKDLQTKCEKK